MVTEIPDWGVWYFNPGHGDNLSPDDGQFTINVEVIAPDDKNTDFIGELKIENLDASNDYCTIQISLSTPKDQTFIKSFFYNILKNFNHIYYLLESLFKF